MGMSKAMYTAGIAEVITGALILFTTDNATWATAGVVIGGLGGLAIGLGFALSIVPDSAEAEVDRWEDAWGSTWSPVCPVHGDRLCVVKTGRCPGYRERNG